MFAVGREFGTAADAELHGLPPPLVEFPSVLADLAIQLSHASVSVKQIDNLLGDRPIIHRASPEYEGQRATRSDRHLLDGLPT